jgi:predicted negative regulator of RcsB-dependent stress response
VATVTAAEQAGRETQDRGQAILAWMSRHRQPVFWGVAIVILAAGFFGWNILSTRESERVASQQLNSARFAFESKNYALAASELSRITANYSGTRSAHEAYLLLAQVRLAQGQSEQAIAVLKQFAPDAPSDYQAQAYGLLGAAYENVAHPKEAAESYEEAAQNAKMDFLRAQFLSDAGRAWLEAGDSAKARAAYQEIVSKLDSTGTAFEAKERLGELGATQGS